MQGKGKPGQIAADSRDFHISYRPRKEIDPYKIACFCHKHAGVLREKFGSGATAKGRQ